MADAAFEKYAKFGKTEKQVAEMKGNLRIETRNVQKMCKDTGIIDAKYSSNLLDNDISKLILFYQPFFWRNLISNLSISKVRVIGKLAQSHAAKYPKGT